MDSCLWAEAANTVVYLENLTPSKNINFEVSFKRWFDREPSLKHLQPFGCLAIALKQKLNGKFDESGNKGLFLGYGETHQSYRIMDPGTVLNPTDTITIEMPPIVQNKSNDNFTSTPVNPSMEQNSSSKKLTPQVNPGIDQNSSGEKSNPVHKGYSWVPEQESIPQNEIFGDMRHPDHLSLDPKTYQEAINGPYSQEWKEAIKSALNNMANHNVWIPTTPNHDVKPLSTTWNREHPLWLFVHVDDLIFGGTWNTTFKAKIKTFSEMEDLGMVKYALGIQINQNKEYISLIQDKFIHQILTEFSVNQASHGTSSYSPLFNFRRASGLLQYIVQCTKPDLSFAASFLSQFLENPKDVHYKALIHTLKYLSGTQTFMLKLGSNFVSHSKTEILGFTDSNWRGGTKRKSFSGSLIYFYGALGWRAHKQNVVALSSAEAEYNALTKSAQDLAWTKQLIFKITNNEVLCTLHSDNQSAIAIASNPVYHHGTRHIDFHLHFIRNLLECQSLNLKYIPTSKMPADLLTKNVLLSKALPHLKLVLSAPKLTSMGE
ncbi:hypothetical protein O181_012074 [Austropuccinia psidii MF-1]|uniref:Retroviral polymerase SH3-like domain-containing protein n=1 Tax=Austropuccinia psidii MF-1 TaxID=1389203 RepID=A0A9Q3GMH6_9BASI|nr:hypothetical protein [Austropuccinia psidii MF-1]